jgi:sugar phosphate isomerase/epimerase
MRLGVFTTVYRDLPVEQALDKLAGLGVQAVELGTGNWPGDGHCPVDELLADESSLRAYRRAVESRGLVSTETLSTPVRTLPHTTTMCS